MRVTGETIDEVYPAVSESVPLARAALVELAMDAGAAQEQVDAVRLATSEALTNAVVHAYPEGPGSVYVTAMVVSDELWVLIADDGCGLRPKAHSPGLGFGLVLISQVSDEFSVLTRASGGTEVRMRFGLFPTARRRQPQSRGSVAAAIRAASASFSTTE
jgi:serine/threonine-protein kinase RsbW